MNTSKPKNKLWIKEGSLILVGSGAIKVTYHFWIPETEHHQVFSLNYTKGQHFIVSPKESKEWEFGIPKTKKLQGNYEILSVTVLENSIWYQGSFSKISDWLGSEKISQEVKLEWKTVLGNTPVHFLSVLDVLKNISNERSLYKLSNDCKIQGFPSGSVVCMEGLKLDCAYLVMEGELQTQYTNTKGEVLSGDLITRGQFFGSISKLKPETYTVTANTDTILYTTSTQNFQAFLGKNIFLKNAFHLIEKSRVIQNFQRYNIPFFSQIPKEKFLKLAHLAEVVYLKRGDAVFRQGDDGDSLYLISHGSFSFRVQTEGIIQLNGRKPSVSKKILSPVSRSKEDSFFKTRLSLSRKHTEEEGPGRFFGEVALLKEVKRTCSVYSSSERGILLRFRSKKLRKFFHEIPNAENDFKVKIARYDIDLVTLINHPVGFRLFTKQTEKDYTKELLDCWKAIEEWKSKYPNLNSEDRRELAKELIIQDFYLIGSPNEINISAEERKKTNAKLREENIPFDCFDVVSAELLAVMRQNSWARFRQSELFREFLKETGSYEVVLPVPKKELQVPAKKFQIATQAPIPKTDNPLNKKRDSLIEITEECAATMKRGEAIVEDNPQFVTMNNAEWEKVLTDRSEKN